MRLESAKCALKNAVFAVLFFVLYKTQVRHERKGESMYDVAIIGAGVSGTAVARELSKYKIKVCVLEKEEDICCGTSKANSGIVHAGYDAPPGSLKAKLNRQGNEMMGVLSKDLSVPFQRTGSLVICQRAEDLPRLQALYERGIENGITGMEMLERDEVLRIEPNVTKSVIAALHATTAGIICPFELNIAMAENAHENGVEFHLQTEVHKIQKTSKGFCIHTSKQEIEARYIVNAAGVYADQIHNMVSEKKLAITVRKGEYLLLDKTAGSHVRKTIFALPNELGKGILIAPTVHGNLLVGPTALDTTDKEGTDTTRAGLEEIIKKAGCNVDGIPIKKVITSFAGLRAHEEKDDFIIEEVVDVPGFIDCAGMESPGLTSCPAVGVMVAAMIKEKLKLKKKTHFIGKRKGILHPETLTVEARNHLILERPEYGTVICRCEMITEGEIIDAIRRPLGANSLDAIKRRVRAGAGRCQSGFCAPKVMEILAREKHGELEGITKSGEGSAYITGQNKDALRGGNH